MLVDWPPDAISTVSPELITVLLTMAAGFGLENGFGLRVIDVANPPPRTSNVPPELTVAPLAELAVFDDQQAAAVDRRADRRVP